MKRNKCLLAATALALLSPLAGQAEDINVEFRATVLATTCSMTIAALDGSAITGNAASGYTLDMGDVSLADIVKQTTSAEKNFKFVASQCSPEMTKITTALTATSVSGSFITNESSETTAATNVGVGFKQKSTSGETWLTPGSASAGKFEWSQAQREANEVEMTVALRELTANAGTIGPFSAKATFNFTYQ